MDLIYDPRQTYLENFQRDLSEFRGLRYNSDSPPLLKLSAGPALNSTYVELFARLGYDFVTYKTVSSKKREPHKFPNILVKYKGQWYHPQNFNWREEFEAITNYFGLPSADPLEWQQDIRQINIPNLVISVAGESLPDFIRVIDLAVEAAPTSLIELDLSCPNLGELFYKNTDFIRNLSQQLKNYSNKFIAKVGPFDSKDQARAFIEHSSFHAIEAINAILQTVLGDYRGVCGPDIIETALQNVRWLSELKTDFKIIGTGGVKDRRTAMMHINAGADIIGVATMAMFDVTLPEKIKGG